MADDTDDTTDIDGLLDDYEAWLAKFDTDIAAWAKRHAKPVTCFSCEQTSPGCCYQKTLITVAEALPIVRHLRRTKQDTPEFRQYLRELGDEMEGTDRATWFHAAHPCVFLKDGRCSIYARRPVICMTYYVINESRCCQPGCHEGIAHLNHTEPLGFALRIMNSIHKGLKLKENKMRALTGSLPRVLLITLEAWDADDFQAHIRSQRWPTLDNLDDWADGKNVFAEQLVQIRRKKEVG